MVSQAATPKRPKVWSAKSKRDLYTAFTTINPCTEKDWAQIADALSNKWPIEDVKAQAKKMKLENLPVVKKQKPGRDAVEAIKKLIPNGKLPNKGTIRREVVNDQILHQLFVMRNDSEESVPLNDSLEDDDLDDRFIHEVLRDHVLDDSVCETPRHFKPLSRRTFFPRSVSSSRSVESQEEIQSVGDDFSMPDRKLRIKYKYSYCAQQLSRRPEKKAKIIEEEEEVESDHEKFTSDDELLPT